MRRTFSILLVIGLLAACASAIAAPGRGQGQGRGAGEAPPAEIGAFSVAASTVTGEHVSFSYGENGIEDFRAQNVTLFDVAVAATDEDEDEGDAPRAETQGSYFRVRTAAYEFSAHDNPGAVSKLKADGAITITFAPGATLAAREESVRFSIGGVNGTVRGDGLGIDGRHIVSEGDDVLIFLDAARGSFDRHREDISDAVVKGHVGAEASFNAHEDDEDAVEQDVVSYGNVTMTTIKAERGNLTVQVEGHGFEGRVLVLNVDGRMLGADRADKLNVTLDNETIEHASSLEDALDPDDDGYSPEYYVVYDVEAQAFQLIVTVPHYSVHTLTVATLIEVLPPSVTLGVLVGVLVVVPMALVLFRRK